MDIKVNLNRAQKLLEKLKHLAKNASVLPKKKTCEIVLCEQNNFLTLFAIIFKNGLIILINLLTLI